MRRVLVIALVAATSLLGLAAPARAVDVPGDLQRMLAPWVDRQVGSGAFTDWPGAKVGGGGGYAESMLGLALTSQGLRTADPAMTAAGERGITWALDHPALQIAPRQSVFEDMALATALEQLGPQLTPELQTRLRERVAATVVVRGVGTKYTNHNLVEALRILTSIRAGAGLDAGDTLRAVGLLGTKVPRYGELYASTIRGVRASVLSDPSANPLAYHALTLAVLARSAQLLGTSVTPAHRRLIVQMAEGSAGLMGPDGDVAYWGRSQEQAWALTFTAYGAQVAAQIRPSTAPRMRALALRALERLERLHLGPDGLYLTPGMAQEAPDGDPRAGLDGYASLPAYTGLTALGLLWLDPAFLTGPVAPLAADQEGAVRNSNRASVFASIRSVTRWWVIKLRPAFATSDDGRTDFGLVAFKRRRPDGTWVDALPLRPYDRKTACVRGTCTGPPPSLGPTAITSAGKARPVGDTLSIGKGTRQRWVTIKGRWVKPDGSTHAPLTAVYRPDAAGVRVTWSGFAAGQGFELTGLFRESAGRVCQVGTTIGNRGGSLRLPPITELVRKDDLSSASQRGLEAVTAIVRAPSTAPLSAVWSDAPLDCP